jgi:precorrin-2/cobalt-factor-2 C20-methyltransferase
MSGRVSNQGILYSVGLGPGDPELITLKALNVIKSTAVIAYFSKKGALSRARTIAGRWLREDIEEMQFSYPITRELHFCEPQYIAALQGFYAEVCAQIGFQLEAGKNVALLCEGDPLFYGSFMHIYIRLRDRFETIIIPGVSGMSGCWTAAKLPITWGDDVLSVLPGTLGGAALTAHLCACDAAIIIKIGGNLAKVRQAIAAAGRSKTAIYVEHGTMEGEIILALDQKTDDHAPYFSMILIPGEGRRP